MDDIARQLLAQRQIVMLVWVFPHFDREGPCGYEIKNQGFAGFAVGGTKGLWS